jgi:hypothetical protein
VPIRGAVKFFFLPSPPFTGCYVFPDNAEERLIIERDDLAKAIGILRSQPPPSTLEGLRRAREMLIWHLDTYNYQMNLAVAQYEVTNKMLKTIDERLCRMESGEIAEGGPSGAGDTEEAAEEEEVEENEEESGGEDPETDDDLYLNQEV